VAARWRGGEPGSVGRRRRGDGEQLPIWGLLGACGEGFEGRTRRQEECGSAGELAWEAEEVVVWVRLRWGAGDVGGEDGVGGGGGRPGPAGLFAVVRGFLLRMLI
jgi:hypothetical protein